MKFVSASFIIPVCSDLIVHSWRETKAGIFQSSWFVKGAKRRYL